MTAAEILTELRSMGNESTRQIFLRHGVTEPLYGVKIEDLKKILKRTKKDHALALQLFDSVVADAQYLAGLMADEKQITAAELRHWAQTANGSMVIEYTIPWIAAESPHGYVLALEWIDAPEQRLRIIGWSILSSWVAIHQDTELDIPQLKKLLQRIETSIHHEPADRVRYVMNTFVISLGCYVPDLTTAAQQAGRTIGKVSVNMNGTACKVPSIQEYIQKVIDRGSVGKKKKTARC